MGSLEIEMSDPARDNYRGSGFDVLTYFYRNRKSLATVCGRKLTRTNLALTDRSLYDTLSNLGLLDEAIPGADPRRVEKGRLVGTGELRLSPEDIKRICDYYPTSGRNALKAARLIREQHGKSHGVATILDYWRREGLKISPPGRIPRKSKT